MTFPKIILERQIWKNINNILKIFLVLILFFLFLKKKIISFSSLFLVHLLTSGAIVMSWCHIIDFFYSLSDQKVFRTHHGKFRDQATRNDFFMRGCSCSTPSVLKVPKKLGRDRVKISHVVLTVHKVHLNILRWLYHNSIAFPNHMLYKLWINLEFETPLNTGLPS